MKKLLIALLFITPAMWAVEATTNATATTSAATSTTAASASPAISKTDFIQKERELQEALPLIRQQVLATIQSVNEQEQKINEQITKLQMQNVQLADQINRLSLQLNESRNQLAHKVQQVQQEQKVQSEEKAGLVKWGIGAFIISFILVIFSAIGSNLKRKKTRQDNEPIVSTPSPEAVPPVLSSSDESEKEYDFMNTQEAMPVKLDLARAYLEMGDHQAAFEVLQGVIEQGNEAQRAQAQELLSTLKA